MSDAPLLLAGISAGLLAVLAAAAWLVLLCLKTLGHRLALALRWHDLKVEAHRLRARHQRELTTLRRNILARESRLRSSTFARRRPPASDEDSGPDDEATVRRAA